MVSEKEEEIVVFRNCRLLRNHAIVKEDLWVRRGKIIDPGEGWSQLSEVHTKTVNPLDPRRGNFDSLRGWVYFQTH